MQNRDHTLKQLEAQRWQAAQAAREQSEQAYRNDILERAGELAQGGYLAESRRMAKRFESEAAR